MDATGLVVDFVKNEGVSEPPNGWIVHPFLASALNEELMVLAVECLLQPGRNLFHMVALQLGARPRYNDRNRPDDAV